MTATAGYRSDIPTPTERIARLPVHRGYPVPWFVAWLDGDGEPVARGEGEPEFRVVAPGAAAKAYHESLCWICGEPRDQYAAFVAGPMCAVNRTSSEPPSHPECAGWAACACPFLARPHARRRESGLPSEAIEPAGVMLRRNPGVALVWASSSWFPWRPPTGGVLFNLGEPEQVAWFAEGRVATREEIERSIDSGLPALRERVDGPRAETELDRRVRYVLDTLVPTS